MDNNNIVGELLEKGQGVMTNQVKKIVTTAQHQITSSQSGGTDAAKGANASDGSQATVGPGIEQNQSIQKPQTSSGNSVNPLQQIIGTHSKSPEEMAQIESARKRLAIEQHKTEYFNPTFNPPKSKEEPIAEKLAREEQEDLWKKQQEEAEKRKADEPLALSQAKRTAEMNRGASG